MRIVESIWMFLAYVEASLDDPAGSRRLRWMGQSTVEYALVGALVVIAAAGAMSLLGNEITTVFTKITTTLSGH